MTFGLCIYLIAIVVITAIAIGDGEIRYLNGWDGIVPK